MLKAPEAVIDSRNLNSGLLDAKLQVLTIMIYHLPPTLYPNINFLLGLENEVERGEKDREFLPRPDRPLQK